MHGKGAKEKQKKQEEEGDGGARRREEIRIAALTSWVLTTSQTLF